MNRIYFNKYPSRISFMFLFCVLFSSFFKIMMRIFFFLSFLCFFLESGDELDELLCFSSTSFLLTSSWILFPFKFETVYMVDLSSSIYDWLRTRLLFVLETWRSFWWNGEVFSKSDSSINFLPWSCALKFKAVTFFISTFYL